MLKGRKYLVTGGGGFVGKALCRNLRSMGLSVVSLSRGKYPELEALGVEAFKVDLSEPSDKWQGLFEGVDGVFHTAAKVDMWGRYDDFVAANIVGTKNVITACRANKVPSLVFTSSPSVIADGTDLLGIDESYPYPPTYTAHYPRTKAEAERFVRANDGIGALRTVALRPHLIFGPGDTNLVPTIVERAKAGRLLRVGEGTNLIDLTHIDDCVRAHILAMEALERDPEKVGGKAYFISQGTPVNMWEWIDQVLNEHGLPKIQRAISKKRAESIASVCEWIAKLLGRIGIIWEPLLTRFLVCEMSTSHYFNIKRAAEDFGFRPSAECDPRTAKTILKSAVG